MFVILENGWQTEIKNVYKEKPYVQPDTKASDCKTPVLRRQNLPKNFLE
jgi:hypothetical protein